MYKWIIYKITCLENNKIYVGQHKTKNINDGYMGSGKLIRRAIEKYGESNFTKEILQECFTKEDAGKYEEYWIETLKATDPEIGYNITKYAWGGQPHTEETKKKLSEQSKGKPKSEEFKEKLKKPKSKDAVENMKKAAALCRHKRIGKKWYHNPTTLESKQFDLSDNIPNGWIPGRGNTQATGKDRKKKVYSEEGLKSIQLSNKNESKRKKISETLTGHTVTDSTRTKISKSLKQFNNEKTGNNPQN